PEFSRRIADIMRIKDEPARIGTKIIDPAGLACSPIVRLSYFHCLQKGKIDHAAIDTIATAATGRVTISKQPPCHHGRCAIRISEIAWHATIGLEPIKIGRVAVQVSCYFPCSEIRDLEMVVGMATQLVSPFNQLPAPFLRDQVPLAFLRADHAAGNIKSAMDAVLVKNRSSGAFRRVGYIVERESDDPFVGWQAERAQRKTATDAVV